MKAVIADSSCWIEMFGEGPLASSCRKELKNSQSIVPTLVIYEVYRKIASGISEDQALSAVAFMSQGRVVELSREVALSAADLSIELRLAMADSMVLAHARHENATLVTLDNDFSGIPEVKVLRR